MNICPGQKSVHFMLQEFVEFKIFINKLTNLDFQIWPKNHSHSILISMKI